MWQSFSLSNFVESIEEIKTALNWLAILSGGLVAVLLAKYLYDRIRDSFAARRDPRQIFRYHDGSRWRACDPIAAYRNLVAHPKYDPNVTPFNAERGDQNAIDAMVSAAQEVFGLTPWTEENPSGLTQMECIAVMVQYGRFMVDLKKNINLPQTKQGNSGRKSSGTAGSKQKGPDGDSGKQPTNSTSDSG